MATSVVHYLIRWPEALAASDARIRCRPRDPNSAQGVLATEWAEHVTCSAQCGTQARADLIIADRARVAWRGPRVVAAEPLAIEIEFNETTGLGMFRIVAPALLTSDDLDSLLRLMTLAEERARLLVSRAEHLIRYTKPGAPADPEHCQHHAARARGERFTCWTCGGEWPATPEGIAAAARASVTGRDA